MRSTDVTKDTPIENVTSSHTQSSEFKLTDLSIFRCPEVVRKFSHYLTIEDHNTLNGLPEFKVMAGDLLEPKLQVRKLLNCVKEADWKGIEEMKHQGLDMWRLMQTPVNHTLAEGKEEIISPLKYAVKILDTYSRDQLLSYVSEKDKPLFLQHIQEQKEWIDLTPLLQAYQDWEAIRKDYRCPPKKNSMKELKEFFKEIEVRRKACWMMHGQKMAYLANDARHFIKEMCRIRVDIMEWSSHAKFDNPIPPPEECDVFNENREWELSSRLPLSSIIPKLGTDPSASLVRGNNRIAITGWTPYVSVGVSEVADDREQEEECSSDKWASYDLAAFRRLLEVRREDLVKQISLLEAPSRVMTKRI